MTPDPPIPDIRQCTCQPGPHRDECPYLVSVLTYRDTDEEEPPLVDGAVHPLIDWRAVNASSASTFDSATIARPTLTDEELAELVRMAVAAATVSGSHWRRHYADDVGRLIAALRASRKNEQELIAERNRLVTERHNLCSEVERLTNRLSRYEADA